MLLLLLAIGCPRHPPTPAPPAEPWFPLGKSELAPWSMPERDSWRDAMLTPRALAMDTALDQQGRVWVATVEPGVDGARLRVRVYEGNTWTILPDVPLPAHRDRAVSLTTDSADHPVVAWLLAPDEEEPAVPKVGWSRWTGTGWINAELPELPGVSEGPLGVVVVHDTVRVYVWLRDWRHGEHRVAEIDVVGGQWVEHRVPRGVLEQTPSVGGRREWAVLARDGDVVLWAGPDPLDPPAPELREVEGVFDDDGELLPTPVPRGAPFLVDQGGTWAWVAARGARWNAAASGSSDGVWLVEGYPHLIGTHDPSEVNRLPLWVEDGGAWTPLTTKPLWTELRLFEDVRLLATPAPTLVMRSRYGRVDVVQWNGHDWWGLDGQPGPVGELSSPDRSAFNPEFVGDQLFWKERGDDGDQLRSSRWTGSAWTPPTTLQLGGGPWLSAMDAGFYHTFVRIEGAWDRLWGLMGAAPPRQTLRWDGASITELPPIKVENPIPGSCGDGVQPPCKPEAVAQLPDTSLLAMVDPGQPPEGRIILGRKVPPRAWELHRFTHGAWTLDGTLPGAWAGPVVLQGGEPASLVIGDRLYLRETGGWREIVSPGTVAMPRALGLGGDRLLLTWITDPEFDNNPERGGRLIAAEFDGASWLPRTAGLPDRVAGERVLAVGPDGAPWLGWTEAGEVLFRRWSGAVWEDLDGSGSGGGVSNSTSGSDQPTIGFLDGKVCVAWIEASDGAAGVNVRCHWIP